jgi:hypothetical protein
MRPQVRFEGNILRTLTLRGGFTENFMLVNLTPFTLQSQIKNQKISPSLSRTYETDGRFYKSLWQNLLELI